MSGTFALFIRGKGDRTAKCGRQYLMLELVDRIPPCFRNALIS